MANHKKRNIFYYFRYDWDLYLMILPAIVLFLIFYYVPMYGVTIAFQDYDIMGGIFGSDWVGMKHIRNFVADPFFF